MVLELWMTGDRTLQSKLRSAITHVRLTQFSGRPHRFPRLLSNFRSLRYLAIESSQILLNPSEWQPVLRTLPPTLITLSIRSPDAATAFRNIGPKSSPNKPLYIQTDYGRGKSNWFNLGAIFPSLTRLELDLCSADPTEDSYWYNATGTLCSHDALTLTELDIAGLPPTLRELRVPLIEQVSASSSIFKVLPRTLERLETILQTSSCDWQFAPPNLEFILRLGPRLSVYNWLKPAQQCPPQNLTIGEVKVENWNAKLVDVLPTNIDHFIISTKKSLLKSFTLQSTDWIAAIPRNITSLCFDSFEHRLSITRLEFNQLPPHLTALTLSGEGNIFDNILAPLTHNEVLPIEWPKTLQTLTLVHKYQPRVVKVLPKTLTCLKVKLSSTSPDDTINTSDLSPNLTTLIFVPSLAGATLSLYFTAPLPSSLTCFGPSSKSPLDSVLYTRDTIEQKLPISLTELTFRMQLDPMVSDAPWTLPSRLIVLRVAQWPIQWLEALPRTLTSLTIARLLGLPEALVLGNFDLFEGFPTSLTFLKLNIGSASRIDITRSLASLLRLRTLECDKRLLLPSNTFRNVPRSLRHLKIAFESVDPSDEPFLPSWLHSCELTCALATKSLKTRWTSLLTSTGR